MPYDPNILEERLLVVMDTFNALISASAYLAAVPAVPVLSERKGDINAEIQKALNNLGLSITVVTPDGDQLKESGDGLSLRVRIVAEIQENVLINQSKPGTYRPALGATIAVMKAVDRKPNGLDPAGTRHLTGLNEFHLDKDQPYQLMPAPRPTYHVTAYTQVEL